MSYSKLHSSIVNSSLWAEPDPVRLLFVTLLAMCNKDGEVFGSRVGINRLANIDPEEADVAWHALMEPDPESSDRMRAPENEGRRIEEIPGGFRLLNFHYYRGLRNDDDRREQNRVAQARFKARLRGKPEEATVSHGKPQKAQAEAEAEKDSEEENIPPKEHTTSRAASPDAEELKTTWNQLPKPFRPIRSMSPGRVTALRQRLREPFWRENWKEAISRLASCEFTSGKNQKGWVADVDFFLRPDSLAKVMEGKYSNGTSKPTRKSGTYELSDEQVPKATSFI